MRLFQLILTSYKFERLNIPNLEQLRHDGRQSMHDPIRVSSLEYPS